jgi:hypothetical protein
LLTINLFLHQSFQRNHSLEFSVKIHLLLPCMLLKSYLLIRII